MKYQEAVKWLYSLEPRGVRLELDRMRRALELAGHPERDLRFVHVAGTNGKGSVCAMIERGLRAAGYRTGLYTSPHLHRFVERIRVDGRPMSEAALARRVTSIRAMFEEPGAPMLTFFEVATLLALQTFRDAGCEVVVLEVGLGGRFDATNVITPELAVITRIAFDHMQYLGDTIEKIAREKAGIIKPRVPVVLGVRDKKARGVIARIAKKHRATIITPEVDETRRLALNGEHQRENAATALAALAALRGRGMRISAKALDAATRKVKWPARLELVRQNPHILFDAAHNPDGCRALARYLEAQRPRRRTVLLFAAMKDKEHRKMLAPLRPFIDAVIFTEPKTARAASARALARVMRGQSIPDTHRAFARAKKIAGKNGLVVVAGSIFLLAEVRKEALGLRGEPPIPM